MRVPALVLRMRIKVGFNWATLCAAALLMAFPARADRRSFIRSYEFQTQPQGNLELELWNEIEAPRGVPGGNGIADALITHRLELEYGLTDRWDAALYHVFQQGGPAGQGNTGFHFDSWRLETRYRLAEPSEWPVDVMLYLEVERPADFSAPFELEEKVIFERRFGPFALVANLVASQKLAREDRGGHIFEVDLGARLEVLPFLRLAVEVWGIQDVGFTDTTTSYYAGPSISVATKKFWLQVGAGAGLNDAAQAMQLRSVLGFNL
jgi:hypothetical protein